MSPRIDDSVRAEAPPEQVWKLLYDPVRFPEWWVGMETVEAGGEGAFTMYPEGYPDFPMPQRLRTLGDRSGVTVSCQVSDLSFEWRLESIDDGVATGISVHVEIPDSEAARLEVQRDVIRRSLHRLAELAGRPDR